MRICTKCGISKPPSEFFKRGDRKDGLTCQCKACIFATCTAWRKAHPERRAQYQKRYRAKLKAAQLQSIAEKQPKGE